MKSTSILVGVLASIGAAQPHGQHRHVHRQPAAGAIEKRAATTVWQTEWQTVSVTKVIGQDTTEFLYPVATASSPSNSSSVLSSSSSSSSSSSPLPLPSPPSSSSAPTVNLNQAAGGRFFQSSSTSSPVEPPSSTSAPSIPVAVVVAVTTQPAPVVAVHPASPTTFVSSTTTPASTDSSGGGSGGGCSGGDLTFYTLGVGSCGITNTDQSDAVVALPVSLMQEGYSGNPNLNPKCGKKIIITLNGVSKPATVVDTCMGCDNSCSLDTSLGFFQLFADEGVGRAHGLEWTWA